MRPRLIFTSGELLDPATRRAIEDGFGAPVFDIYGCTELKEIAWECPAHAGLHLNADWILLEVDPPGSAGKILVTPLYSRAMPLLRYEVGDTGWSCPAAALAGAACRWSGRRSAAAPTICGCRTEPPCLPIP